MRAPVRISALTLGLALGFVSSQGVFAADLVEVWNAASLNDRDYAVARATLAAALPKREQAAALWRPNVGVTASAGLGSSETGTRGTQFSAPGFGQSAGVGFNTSVTNGTSSRWALLAVQPLYNPERRVQQQQLGLSVDVAELEWQTARQALMLRTAERYFDLALAEESVRVLKLQLDVVQRASTEADDRFRLGAVPVTDTHEARARLAAVRAQVLTADNDLHIKRSLLADSTGLPVEALSTRLPTAGAFTGRPRPLNLWLADAQAGNLGIRTQGVATELAKREATKYSGHASVTVDLIAQASRDRLSGSGDFGPASNTGANRMVGVQVSIPLFTGGYRTAKTEEALRLIDKATAQTDQMRQLVAQQVRSAWLSLNVGAEHLQALAEGLTASTARRDATRVGQQVGHRTTQDVLNAENDHATALLALVQARVGLVMEGLRLTALTGQLNDAALRASNAGLELANSR